MSIYSDKLAHQQVVINCQYSVAQMGTWEDTRLFRLAILDDVMSQSELVKIYFCPLNRVMKK